MKPIRSILHSIDLPWTNTNSNYSPLPKSQFNSSCDRALSAMKEKGPFEIEVISSIRFAIKLEGSLKTKQYIYDHSEDECFASNAYAIIDRINQNPKLTNEEIADTFIAETELAASQIDDLFQRTRLHDDEFPEKLNGLLFRLSTKLDD